ncbi:hypothetical protein ZOSMA_289G00380 [Zostera marina]|uniref:IST1-like protein n=1 Tax=Zostera marina TaxID=29655 RepID=A0A0K9PEX4_ZOSMR|nr:hypothetical protein ZOSMA_289G00380 [Zostera marina]
MSMLDAFFNKAGFFKAAKCKTLLKLTIPRIKLLRNRRDMQLKQMRKEIAKLLEIGQEATARIRVEHIIREENMMAAQEIIELYCELIAVRLPIIETQRECPIDLKEAISSICFAAPRCSDLPELQQVQIQFVGKYGKEFVAAASELLPDCGVNRQIVELLSVRAPSVDVKLKLMKEIAEEHNLDWDPYSTETEFLKPHEDLLNGPGSFISGSSLSIPKEKHNETLLKSESDDELDILDLPEVPKVQPTHDASVDSETHNMVNFSPDPPFEMPQDLLARQSHDETSKSTRDSIPRHDPSLEYNVLKSAEDMPPTVSPHTPSSSTTISQDVKQNIPFVSSSPPHITPMNESAETASNDKTKSGDLGGLNDVMKAARIAADSADRAAAAARAAASLAEVRISEFDVKKNVHDYKNGSEVERDISNHPISLENSIAALSPETCKPEPESLNTWDHMQQQPSRSFDDALSPKTSKLEPESFNNWDPTQQPSRSASLDDDPYFSYPNLFSRQNSQLSPDVGK